MTTHDNDAGGHILLRPEEAARRLGVTVRALDKWRERSQGPQYVRLGARAIRYPLDALEEWIRSREVGRQGWTRRGATT